jgi:hypothetical protein
MERAAEFGDESAIKGITGAAPGAMEHARELVCGIEDGESHGREVAVGGG